MDPYGENLIRFPGIATSIVEHSHVSFEVSQIYPNPFSGSASVNVRLTHDSDISLQVEDISGKAVLQIEKGWVIAGDHTIRINAADLHPGIYFCMIHAGAEKIARKMIIR
jgi:hypothetical protein